MASDIKLNRGPIESLTILAGIVAGSARSSTSFGSDKSADVAVAVDMHRVVVEVDNIPDGETVAIFTANANAAGEFDGDISENASVIIQSLKNLIPQPAVNGDGAKQRVSFVVNTPSAMSCVVVYNTSTVSITATITVQPLNFQSS